LVKVKRSFKLYRIFVKPAVKRTAYRHNAHKKIKLGRIEMFKLLSWIYVGDLPCPRWN
jgi:hypothetical protein